MKSIKTVLKINQNYSKAIKTLKITIIIMFLLLCQITIAIFYGNQMLMSKMEEQGVPFTTFYVRNLKEYGLPDNFEEYLYHNAKEEFHLIKDIKSLGAFFTKHRDSDVYILKAADAPYTQMIGKDIHQLSEHEVAVSSYYAYTHFGSLKKALGKTIKVPITYTITENKEDPLKAKKVTKHDEIQLKIATVYKHIGLEKRYLNYLSNPDHLVDSGEVMYKDQMFVSSSTFEELLLKYEEDLENSNNTFSCYQIIYDAYDPEVEMKIEGFLRVRVKNYDVSLIKAEITYALLRNSENINTTMQFINSFQFVALYILMGFSFLYLIYLQRLYTKPNFDILRSIGFKISKQRFAALLHEARLFTTSYLIWMAFNLIIHGSFGYRVKYLQEAYQFNLEIIKYCSLIFFLLFLITVLLINGLDYFLNSGRLRKSKSFKTTKDFSTKSYTRRFFKLYFSKYLILTMITAIVSGGLFATHHMVNTLVEIYKNANVLRYDLSARMTGEVFTNIQEYIKDYAIIRAESNNFFVHKYDQNKIASAYRGSVVWLYGDSTKFLKKPEIGAYPNFNEVITLEDYVKMYPHYRKYEGFEKHYQQFKDAPFLFRMWITKSISEKLNATVGSFIEAFVWEGFHNEAIYPVCGITNIFSNNGDTIYIFPSPSKSAVFTDAIRNPKYKDGTFNVIMNLKRPEDKELVLGILRNFEERGKAYKIIADTDEIRESIGALNTKVNQGILFANLALSMLLLGAVYLCKRQDDLLNQATNLSNHYSMGVSSESIIHSIDRLNLFTLILGTLIGFILSILLSGRLEEVIYNLMQVIK